ncbi:type I-E CRISPR-associated protein Cas7/Cse4/CasC [bacterium]|jgi:CRISPR system Cascade subunit CasC|nr:type I-E CRISPR-associated protein Cas7/Cse4/CasC [bacterium]
MNKFVQLHILTNYGPSNLNRDDLGRPKTVVVGGTQRLRVSSQCLKRAWRTADVFEAETGIRTKEIGVKIKIALTTELTLKQVIDGADAETAKKSTIAEKNAQELAWKIASVFVDKMKKDGKADDEEEAADRTTAKKDAKKSNVDKKTLKSEQMVFFYPEEIANVDRLIAELKRGNKKVLTEKDVNDLLVTKGSGADVGMFGRMMACSPRFNVEAAVQVAHAFTVHKAAVEDDYFSAVDDLNKHEEHSGSGHIGEAEFGAGLFYLYACIDRTLLKENLGNNDALVKKAISALVESAVTVSPTGKQNSFASRAYASCVVAEKGNKQPRSLASAFLKPVRGEDVLGEAVKALMNTRKAFNEVYKDDSKEYVLRTVEPEGTLDELKQYCSGE